MSIPVEEVAELKVMCDEAATASEGGTSFILLRNLQLPDGCKPDTVDALLCPTLHSGYPSRLFFAERIQSPAARNWNFNGRILGRNWHAFSWKLGPEKMRLAQMVRVFLSGLRKK